VRCRGGRDSSGWDKTKEGIVEAPLVLVFIRVPHLGHDEAYGLDRG